MSILESPHPGSIIRHECLEPLNLTVIEAARALGISRQALNNVVNGKAGISPEMAIRLDKVFGEAAETWLVRQLAYDLAQARKRSDQIKVRPIREKSLQDLQARLL